MAGEVEVAVPSMNDTETRCNKRLGSRCALGRHVQGRFGNYIVHELPRVIPPAPSATEAEGDTP